MSRQETADQQSGKNARGIHRQNTADDLDEDMPESKLGDHLAGTFFFEKNTRKTYAKKTSKQTKQQMNSK